MAEEVRAEEALLFGAHLKGADISGTIGAQGEILIRDIIDRMRHDGCGGRTG